jgi:hypothetical protein
VDNSAHRRRSGRRLAGEADRYPYPPEDFKALRVRWAVGEPHGPDGKQIGLDAIALTEHFHGRESWSIYRHLFREYRSDRGVFWAEGVAIIPGAEANIREGAHVIVLGEVGELRRLDRAFATQRSEGYEPRLREFLDTSENFDVVRIGAHMFRPTKELGKFRAAQSPPSACTRGQRQGLRHRADVDRPSPRTGAADRRGQ